MFQMFQIVTEVRQCLAIASQTLLTGLKALVASGRHQRMRTRQDGRLVLVQARSVRRPLQHLVQLHEQQRQAGAEDAAHAACGSERNWGHGQQ